MGDSAIRIVRIDQMLIMGVSGTNSLDQPRVIGRTPGGGLVLLEIVGSPKSISLGDVAFSFECHDVKLIKSYKENVTGIIMPDEPIPSSNVIPIGGQG